MIGALITKRYEAPPISEREILRYAGVKTADDATVDLLRSCLDEAKKQLVYNLVYRAVSVDITGGVCDFDSFSVNSEALSKNLCGAESAILFCATVGVGIDRLIKKYTLTSPVRALMLSAIGAERCEALCDAFTEEIWEKYGRVRPRFSAGFGGVPLSVQRNIFALLSPEKHIGVCLNDSLLMSPSKSVTAFLGVKSYELS